MLCEKNKNCISKGEISKAYYEVVKGVHEKNTKKGINFPYGSRTVCCGNSKTYTPDNFKKILGKYNSQFKYYEANDSKDLILYLLQTMHEELNYLGDSPISNLGRSNQYDRENSFVLFENKYNYSNLSIISRIFYGTYEITTKCRVCGNIFYSYQKFEFISFPMRNYKNKTFNLLDGFKDNQKEEELKGDNKYFCNHCNKLTDSLMSCKIIYPPNKMLINIDYGKNKKFKPKNIKFNEEIDITEYITFNFGKRIKYKILGVCTHLGNSGSSGHYIAYCRNNKSNEWYNFNDSSFDKCDADDIYEGSPYLLLYEKI